MFTGKSWSTLDYWDAILRHLCLSCSMKPKWASDLEGRRANSKANWFPSAWQPTPTTSSLLGLILLSVHSLLAHCWPPVCSQPHTWSLERWRPCAGSRYRDQGLGSRPTLKDAFAVANLEEGLMQPVPLTPAVSWE